MANPTWSEIPNADIDPNSPGKESLFEDLRNNLRALRVALYWSPAAHTATTTSATFVALYTFSILLPSVGSYTGFDPAIVLETDYDVAAGSADLRIRETVAGVNSGEVNGLTATSPTSVFIPFTVAGGFVPGWLGSIRQFELQGKVSGGNLLTVDGSVRQTTRVEF